MTRGILENVRVAWDGLLNNKLRSALTMLGVIIGVASVVALLSIGEGASSAITARISSAGTNLVFASPGAGGGGGMVRGAPGSATTLTLADAEAIAASGSVADALAVAAQYDGRAQIVYGDTNTNSTVSGVTPAYRQVFGAEVRALEVKESAALGAAVRAAHALLNRDKHAMGWQALWGTMVGAASAQVIYPSAEATRVYQSSGGLLDVYAACERFAIGRGPDPDAHIHAFRGAFTAA